GPGRSHRHRRTNPGGPQGNRRNPPGYGDCRAAKGWLAGVRITPGARPGSSSVFSKHVGKLPMVLQAVLIILAVLVAIVVLFLIIVALQPSTFRVARSTKIAATPAAVF